MPRIAGVDIPPDKPIRIALRYIHGVGPTNSDKLLKEAGIDGQRRAKDVTEEELGMQLGLIYCGYRGGGSLRVYNQQKSARRRDVGAGRFSRNGLRLPGRG